jgi:hypothetical protein
MTLAWKVAGTMGFHLNTCGSTLLDADARSVRHMVSDRKGY